MTDRRDFIKTVIVGTVGGSLGCRFAGGNGDGAGEFDGMLAGETVTAQSERHDVCHQVRDGASLPVPPAERSVDAVIVGCGLSGLTAAYRLLDADILCLENEPWVGGNARVATWDGFPYSVGAFFTHSMSTPMKLYEEVGLELQERHSMFFDATQPIMYDDRIVHDRWGEGFQELNPRSSWSSWDRFKEDMLAIDAYARQEELDRIPFRDLLGPYEPEVVRWFDLTAEFMGGTSAELSAYAGVLYTRVFNGEGLGLLLTQRQADHGHYWFPGGLGPASKRLAERVEEAGAGRIVTSASVYRIANAGDQVHVSYMLDGEPHTLSAGVCIVACQKFMARHIVADLPRDQDAAMQSYRYHPYLALLMGFKEPVELSRAQILSPLAGGMGAGRPREDGRMIARTIVPVRPERRGELLTEEGIRAVGERLTGALDSAPGAVSVSATAVDLSSNMSSAATVDFTILPGWLQLGPSQGGVTDVAIASDGASLYRFYCIPVDICDEGRLDRWSGGAWTTIAHPTNQCHQPDIEVEGSLWVASFADDSPDYGFASNANGPTVVFTGIFLVHQWGMDVAIAQGRPYMAFAARYSDGNPFNYMMLHVISPIPAGAPARLRGGWGGVVGQDIATDPAIAGDANGWYAVTRQGPNLYVKKGYRGATQTFYENIGAGFSFSGDPTKPEIIVYQGGPVVAWMEDGQTSLHLARFDGANWIAFGTDQVASGIFGRVRMDVLGDDLYVVDAKSSASPRLTVSHYDGANWTELPDALSAIDNPTSSRGDIAVTDTGPVVAYISGGVLRIKKYFP